MSLTKEHLKNCPDKASFAQKLKAELRYYFWSKAEWELVIEITENNRIYLNPWCGCKNPQKTRIDVTDEPSFDWRSFAEEHIKKQIYCNKAKIDVYDQQFIRV